MKISLNFPEKLLEKLNKYCVDNDYEKSELIRELVRVKLGETSTTPSENKVEKISTPKVENKTSTMPVKNGIEFEGDRPLKDNEFIDDLGVIQVKKYNRVVDIEKLKQLTNV